MGMLLQGYYLLILICVFIELEKNNCWLSHSRVTSRGSFNSHLKMWGNYAMSPLRCMESFSPKASFKGNELWEWNIASPWKHSRTWWKPCHEFCGEAVLFGCLSGMPRLLAHAGTCRMKPPFNFIPDSQGALAFGGFSSTHPLVFQDWSLRPFIIAHGTNIYSLENQICKAWVNKCDKAHKALN